MNRYALSDKFNWILRSWLIILCLSFLQVSPAWGAEKCQTIFRDKSYLESGRIHVKVERTGFFSRETFIKPEEILRTEVRAHYRHWRAFNVLFTQPELALDQD